jgi:hypothetical protein
MVFFVDEVNLGVQFLYDLLIVLLEILHCQFFVVLTSLVKLTESQNFRVPHLDALFKLLYAWFQRLICFLEILTAESDLVGSLVRPTKLLSPFLIANGWSCHCISLRGLLALGIFTVKMVIHLHYLLSAPNDIVRETNAVHSAQNLVLTRHVELWQDFI